MRVLRGPAPAARARLAPAPRMARRACRRGPRLPSARASRQPSYAASTARWSDCSRAKPRLAASAASRRSSGDTNGERLEMVAATVSTGDRQPRMAANTSILATLHSQPVTILVFTAPKPRQLPCGTPVT